MVGVPSAAARAHEATVELKGQGQAWGRCVGFSECSETVSPLTAVVQDPVQALTPLSRFLRSRPGWKEKEGFSFRPFNFTHADTLLL